MKIIIFWTAAILSLIFAVISKVFYENENEKLCNIFASLSAVSFMIVVSCTILIYK